MGDGLWSERVPDAQTRRREPARRRAPLMGGLGGRRKAAHNATPAADYRTALLFDSP